MANGRCSIHGTELTSAGTCWRCVGETHSAPPVVLPPPPCPECARLRQVADGWQKQAEDERRNLCAFEEHAAKDGEVLRALVRTREKERDAAIAERDEAMREAMERARGTA